MGKVKPRSNAGGRSSPKNGREVRVTRLGYGCWVVSWSLLGAQVVSMPLFGVGGVAVLAVVLCVPEIRWQGPEDGGAFYETYWGVPEAELCLCVSAPIFLALAVGWSDGVRTRFCSPTSWLPLLVAGVFVPVCCLWAARKDAGPHVVPVATAAVVAACVVLLGAPVSAAEKGTEFADAWALLVSLGLTLDWPGAAGYYRWFATSEVELSRKRGLGFNAARPYGVVKAPKLRPDTFDALAAFLGAWLAAAPFLGRTTSQSVFFLPTVADWRYLAAWPLFLTHCSQLGQETSVGQHAAIPVHCVLLYLGLCDHDMALACIKIHLTSLYFAAGLLKLLASAVQKKAWWRAPTMQSYVFAALWSRPAGKYTDMLARYVISSPALCSASAVSGLVFELCFPLALVSRRCAVALSLCGLAFHVGVFLLQGINFVSYWAPALLVFLVDQNTVLSSWKSSSFSYDSALGGGGVFFSFTDVLQHLPTVIAVVHLVLQLVFALTFNEVFSTGPLPWSCMPVFAVPTNVFDPPKSFVMTGGSQRCAGQMGVLEWRGPYYRKASWFDFPKEDALKLPFPAVWLLVRNPADHAYDDVAHCLGADFDDDFAANSFVLFANFDLPDDLAHALRAFARFLRASRPRDAYDPLKLARLLHLQQTCRRHFDDYDRRDRFNLVHPRLSGGGPSPRWSSPRTSLRLLTSPCPPMPPPLTERTSSFLDEHHPPPRLRRRRPRDDASYFHDQ